MHVSNHQEYKQPSLKGRQEGGVKGVVLKEWIRKSTDVKIKFFSLSGKGRISLSILSRQLSKS